MVLTNTRDMAHQLVIQEAKGRNLTKIRVAAFRTLRLFMSDVPYQTYSTFLRLKSRSKLLGRLFKV